MDWTEAQLEELQAMAGDNVTVTADNADRVAFRLAKNMAKRNGKLKADLDKAVKTKAKGGSGGVSAMDPDLLRSRCTMAVERVQLLQEKRGLTAIAAKNLCASFLAAGTVDLKTGLLSDDAQPIEAMFVKAEDGSFPYQKVLAAFEDGKPTDLGKNLSKDQPAPRDIPGSEGDKPFAFDNTGTPMTIEAANKLRTSQGLPAYTPDQFRAVFPEVKVA